MAHIAGLAVPLLLVVLAVVMLYRSGRLQLLGGAINGSEKVAH